MQKYVPIEYPKWVDGVVFQNAAEEEAHREALSEVTVAAGRSVPRGPSAAGMRMRRTRERRREGKRTISCELSSAQIDALALGGFIDPVMRDNAAELARGVGRLMDRLAQSA